MKMKVLTAVCAMACFSLSSYAQVEDAIKLCLTDGSLRFVRIDDNPKISIDNNALSIKSESLQLDFKLNEVKSWSFSEYDFSSNVSETDVPQFNLSLNNGVISIGGLHNESLVRLFDMSGNVVDSAITGQNGYAVLKAPAIGIYMIKSKSLTFKIVVRK